MATILIADDEQGICDAFSRIVAGEGHHAVTASTGHDALAAVEAQRPDAVFLDYRLPDIDGLEVLSRIRTVHPDLPVILMTAHGTMQTAMEAMRLDAFDYLGKPVELDRIRGLLARALERGDLDAPAAAEPVGEPAGPHDIVGVSPGMQEIYKLMGLLTTNSLTVLITGESGVGKELVARGIHTNSDRRDAPFMAVNCAAIPANLLESELFGHVKGAFTDAARDRTGRMEAAGHGTLFLDEISELPLPLQGKLLRVLQERSFERVGSVAARPLHARIIAATNRDLATERAAGRFRDDLYHRLNLVTLNIPPLRDRAQDIEVLARHFLARAASELDRPVHDIDAPALARLGGYAWPGNVRELEHAVKRAVLTARGPVLTEADLESFDQAPPAASSEPAGGLATAVREALRQARDSEDADSPFHAIVSRVERALIDEALRECEGNQVAASRLLGLNRTTLRKKLDADDPE